MLSDTEDNPVFLRQVIENYKLRVRKLLFLACVQSLSPAHQGCVTEALLSHQNRKICLAYFHVISPNPPNMQLSWIKRSVKEKH